MLGAKIKLLSMTFLLVAVISSDGVDDVAKPAIEVKADIGDVIGATPAIDDKADIGDNISGEKPAIDVKANVDDDIIGATPAISVKADIDDYVIGSKPAINDVDVGKSRPKPVNGGRVVIFPMMTKSQLLSASRIASILTQAGHEVTIVIPSTDLPDLKPSSDFEILTYQTPFSREEEQKARKEVLNFTPRNILLGKASASVPHILAGRCRGILFDEAFERQFQSLQPEVAIVHHMMACAEALLSRLSIPYLDFCSVPLFPGLCAAPHRIPANPSFVPNIFFSDDEMPFLSRVFNAVFGAVFPVFYPALILGPSQSVATEYQTKHHLPHTSLMHYRGNASFLLVHGDLTFETIRPSMPKVVYIGGVQCDEARPIEDESLRQFVEEPAAEAGVIVFSLGGSLDTDSLPHGFIETFFDIFRSLPQRVVWKLKKVPPHLLQKLPSNVKLVDWMPQQDLLGHRNTNLFISHGGIQGAFESICHGKPVLGIGLFGDQVTNLEILVKKGMALMVEDYRNMKPSILRGQIRVLLGDEKLRIAAKNAQSVFNDQPQTPVQRLQFAVGYALRYAGADHLSSKAAMQLHWIQFYLIDVLLFLAVVVSFVFCLLWCCLKFCYRRCCATRKIKEE